MDSPAQTDSNAIVFREHRSHPEEFMERTEQLINLDRRVTTANGSSAKIDAEHLRYRIQKLSYRHSRVLIAPSRGHNDP